MNNQQEQKWPNLFQFIKKPLYSLDFDNQNTKFHLLTHIAFAFLIMFVSNILQNFFLLPVSELTQSEQAKINLFFEENMQRPIQLFLFVGIIQPIIEEFWFRMGLKLYSRIVMIFWVIAMLIYLTLFLIMPDWLDNHTIDNMIIPAFFMGFICLLFYFSYKKIEDIEQDYRRFYFYIFWGSSLIFGLSHFSNFNGLNLTPAFIYLILIYTLSRSFLGAVLAYIRLRFGFGYAAILHIINNSLAIFFLLIYYSEKIQ